MIISLNLLYATLSNEVSILAKQATDNTSKKGIQYVINKAPALNSTLIPQGKNKVISNTNTYSPQEIFNISLPYNINQPAELNSLDSKAHLISIQKTMKFLEINIINITTS